MTNKMIKSQLSNLKTYEMYKRQFLTLAENVFIYDNLPDYIDVAYLNSQLLRKGSIAFFYDDVIEEVIALPYISRGKMDIYNRPTSIMVMGRNGYTRELKQGEFVIMYDNNGRYPMWLDVLQYAERIAQIVRTIDINVANQKTARIWKTKEEMQKSLQDLVNNVDGYNEVIMTYKDIDLDDTQSILAPVPYVADKLNLEKDKIYNEFLRLIGIANISYEKKERQITDEIQAMQGGTIASRFARFEPRKKAIKEINEKFGLDIKVRYYDGLPNTLEEDDEIIERWQDFEEDDIEKVGDL